MFYPLQFEKNIPFHKPIHVNLKQQSLVLWRGPNGLSCFPDACPHRNARLSQGRVNESTGNLECTYHGWQFNENGKCAKIPQMEPPLDKSPLNLPKACNARSFATRVYDGLVWVSDVADDKKSEIFPIQRTTQAEYTNDKRCLVTDMYLNTQYSYFLQIENLLDPAHIHFVHDGFQGKRSSACPLKITKLVSTDDEISGYVQHVEGSGLPDMRIRFIAPSTVDVTIYNSNQEIIRKNIIYVSPAENDKANVMFRDVAYHRHLPFHMFVSTSFIDAHFPIVNGKVADAIMQQDVSVLLGQQANTRNGYNQSKYVMPSQSDRLVVEFRKWCQRRSRKTGTNFEKFLDWS